MNRRAEHDISRKLKVLNHAQRNSANKIPAFTIALDAMSILYI